MSSLSPNGNRDLGLVPGRRVIGSAKIVMLDSGDGCEQLPLLMRKSRLSISLFFLFSKRAVCVPAGTLGNGAGRLHL